MAQSKANITIRPCTAEDIAKIGPVEKSASTRFSQYPALADLVNDTTSQEFLAEMMYNMNTWDAGQTAGSWSWLYVACVDDTVIGFLAATQLDAAAHIEEIAVAASHQKFGVGSRLMRFVLESISKAASASMQPEGQRLDGTVSLKTYADVPWNKPWYEKFGFVETTADSLGREHVHKSQHDPAQREGWRRCFMVRR